ERPYAPPRHAPPTREHDFPCDLRPQRVASNRGDHEENECTFRGLPDVPCYINPSTGAAGPTEPGPEVKKLDYDIGRWNVKGGAKPFGSMRPKSANGTQADSLIRATRKALLPKPRGEKE